mmetsp:Transcript_3111/g.11083  ORF Transcript_3111/g.11083 Transcript_3111/m.11083 type:complete len:231 (+) Transcript_3111:948-1640(+)
MTSPTKAPKTFGFFFIASRSSARSWTTLWHVASKFCSPSSSALPMDFSFVGFSFPLSLLFCMSDPPSSCSRISSIERESFRANNLITSFAMRPEIVLCTLSDFNTSRTRSGSKFVFDSMPKNGGFPLVPTPASRNAPTISTHTKFATLFASSFDREGKTEASMTHRDTISSKYFTEDGCKERNFACSSETPRFFNLSSAAFGISRTEFLASSISSSVNTMGKTSGSLMNR